MHTLLDLRGSIPSFIHVSDGKLHDVHALDPLLICSASTYPCHACRFIHYGSVDRDF
jgi:hypothetical protein